MADHMIKMNEVPKGQKYQQFKDYYRIPVISGLIILVFAVSILKTTVFKPKPDASILLAASRDVSQDFITLFESFFAQTGLDFNGDGKCLMELNPVTYNEATMKTDPNMGMAMQAKLMGSLSTAESIIQIVDDYMYDYLDGQEIIGTYADLGDENVFGKAPEEKLKIPLTEVAFFSRSEFSGMLDGYYLTVRPKAASQLGDNAKKIAAYENQIKTLVTLCK